jgi:hypothetical protein
VITTIIMSNDRSTSPISVPSSENRPRRGSFAGLPFDLFSKQNSNPSVQPTGNNTQANQQRRLSISTLGLSGSPTQASTFGSRAFRRGSLSSSWGSVPNNEDAVAEDGEASSPGVTSSSPFARRVSFGAQALREARAGSIGNGEGFNWTEALRHRAERAPSIGGPVSPQNPSRQAGHQRAASIASMEQPIREIPKQPKQNKPDFFQEKILRGDFMD